VGAEETVDRGLNQAALNGVEGWLSWEAQTLTELLFAMQHEHGLVTGVLELGVHKGKYLALLAHCARGLDVPIVGVDAFLEALGKKLSPEHRRGAERLIHDAVASVTGRESRAQLIGAFTAELDVADLAARAPRGYSFISVDAGHDAADLVTDVALAARLLSDGGIAALDDIFNAVTPGVAEGVFRFFGTHPDTDLAPFATGGNKTFFCRRSRHPQFYAFAGELAHRAEAEFPALRGTTALTAGNTSAGWTPRLLGFEVVPFL
jgi:hypothetical protein